MKINVDVECTPEEARRFLGLPDLAPLHDLYLEQMKRLMAEGVTPDMMQAMLRNWLPMGETGMTMWRQLFDQGGSGAAVP